MNLDNFVLKISEMAGVGVVILIVLVILVLIIIKSIKIVPQQEAWLVERLGKFRLVLQPGLTFIIPMIDRIAYKHTLKEQVHEVDRQGAITRDNVVLDIDGILYMKVLDPIKASYGVSNYVIALFQLAQTSMRSEIGKITMDQTFESREQLNEYILRSMNEACSVWGVQCMRYEIKNINPPATVLKAMELQVAAERHKRAVILESEGKRTSQINVAEAEKQQVVLSSEAAKIDQINRAEGEAQSILLVAKATAEGIETVASTIQKAGGEQAVALRVAEKYVEAFSNLAKEGNSVIIPSDVANPSAVIAQALGIFGSITSKGVGK